jgi:hypothetical protein
LRASATFTAAERSVQDVLALSPAQELEDKRAETDFAAALCGLTILRYLSDHVTTLPLGVMSRLLGAHDAVMALLPLVEAPPWVRSRKGGKVSDARYDQPTTGMQCHRTNGWRG